MTVPKKLVIGRVRTRTDSVAWDYRNPAQVDLVADKPEYRAGDKARILVKTPISGEALITIERGSRVLRTQRVQLAGNAPTFDVPIQAGDAPRPRHDHPLGQLVNRRFRMSQGTTC